MKHVHTIQSFTFSHGICAAVQFYRDGLKHRSEGPAYVSYYPSGALCLAIWYQHGKRHRTNLPAYVSFHPTGNFDILSYWKDGERDFTRSPYIIRYTLDGQKRTQP